MAGLHNGQINMRDMDGACLVTLSALGLIKRQTFECQGYRR